MTADLPRSELRPPPGPASAPPVLLLTRPQAQSERFAAEATARLGPLRVVIAPLMRIEALPLPLDPLGYPTLIFTSENGVAALVQGHPDPARLSERLSGRPAWCVGPRTAAVARAAGFAPRQPSGGDAEALIAEITAARPAQPLLHLRGERAVTDLAGRLRAAGLACDEAVVYAQKAEPPATAALAALTGRAPVLLPLFSPRSAALAAEMLAGALADATAAAPLWPVAISRAAAERWQAGGGPAPVAVAHSPDARGMIEALAGAWQGLTA